MLRGRLGSLSLNELGNIRPFGQLNQGQIDRHSVRHTATAGRHVPAQKPMVSSVVSVGDRTVLIFHRLSSPFKMLRQDRQRKMATRNSELKKRNEERNRKIAEIFSAYLNEKPNTTDALASSEINSLNFQKGSHPEIFFAAELAGSISQNSD
jgi:hypothetical protein